METLRITCEIATVVIAVVNVILVIYIFRNNNNRDLTLKEKERKLNLLKTLVLDYSMQHFYRFFDEIDIETHKLMKRGLDENAKKSINESLLNSGKKLEQKFIDLFIGIDNLLYEQIKERSDKLLDGYTECIFDEGVNLYAENKFNDLITNKMIECKSQIIKILFSYSG
jgi:hypothetical protein